MVRSIERRLSKELCTTKCNFSHYMLNLIICAMYGIYAAGYTGRTLMPTTSITHEFGVNIGPIETTIKAGLRCNWLPIKVQIRNETKKHCKDLK